MEANKNRTYTFVFNIPERPRKEYILKNEFRTKLRYIREHFYSDIKSLFEYVRNLDLRKIESDIIELELTENSQALPFWKNAYDSLKNKGDDAYFSTPVKGMRHAQKFSRAEVKHALDIISDSLIKAKRKTGFELIMPFVYLVSLLDAALLDIFQVTYRLKPTLLIPIGKGTEDKKLTYSEILSFDNIADMHELMISSEVENIGRKSIKEQFNTLRKICKSGVLSDDILVSIAEIRETRNIHVHNKGVVNSIYLDNVVNSQFTLSQFREISPDYLVRCMRLMQNVVRETTNVVADIFEPLLEDEYYKI